MNKTNKVRGEFLLSFFTGEDKYTEKEVNGWWLIKNYNGATKKWQVSVYPAESYRRFKDSQKCLTYEVFAPYNNE